MSELVPIEDWGKDHWSTLAYIESRCVDHFGKINPDHMRPSPGRPPVLLGKAQRRRAGPIGNYPTRLRGGKMLDGHDDWDCIEDFRAAELLEITPPADVQEYMPGIGYSGLQELEIMRDGTYSLTERGLAVCAAIRVHKSRGGSFGSFCLSDIKAIDRQTTCA